MTLSCIYVKCSVIIFIYIHFLLLISDWLYVSNGDILHIFIYGSCRKPSLVVFTAGNAVTSIFNSSQALKQFQTPPRSGSENLSFKICPFRSTPSVLHCVFQSNRTHRLNRDTQTDTCLVGTDSCNCVE